MAQYHIEFAPGVIEHLDSIERKYHRLLQDAIEAQLRFEPDRPVRNRKVLRQPAPFNATWELRCGPNNRFRVLYQVDHQTTTVGILAIGVKKGNRLIIGHEEVES